MKNPNYFIIISAFLIFNCATQKNNSRLKSYEIFPSLSWNDSDSTKVNELKFKPVFNSMDSQKFMFQKFGMWNNSISINRTHPLLIWSELKLFDWSDELYTVGVSGEKEDYIYYCSALVYNSKSEDCLKENSKVKDSLVNFFILGTEKIINSNKEFENKIKTLN